MEENLMISDKKTTNEYGIIWAFGPRSRYAHAYPGRTALETGIPLCGVQCTPTLVSEDFDPNDPNIGGFVCPVCRARLSFARFAKPLRELRAAGKEKMSS